MTATVLLLKSPSDDDVKDKYQDILEKEGFSVQLVPVIEFNFINTQSLREKLSKSDEYSGIVFTSKRAVDAVNIALNDDREDIISGWRKKTVFVVGVSTQEYVNTVLGLESVGEESGNADNLAQVITTRLNNNESLLFPRGNLARETITKKLTSHGLTVDDHICYETQPNSNLDHLCQNLDTPSHIVVFSPSGAAASLHILEKTFRNHFQNIVIIAIGPTTEAEIVKLGFKVTVTLSKPTPEALVETLLSIKIDL